MHEVFPKAHNFGDEDFGLIKKHLRKMLLPPTEEEWKSSCNDACTVLVDKNIKLEKLEQIYDRSAYYSRYYAKILPW